MDCWYSTWDVRLVTATIPQFFDMLTRMGTDVLYHREDGGTECPCRTFEGFRDPQWHVDNPDAPVCNEQGFLTDPIEFTVKASIQPFRRRGNIPAQRADANLQDVRQDDKFGIFPVTWNGHTLDFSGFSEAGEDYIIYDNCRYVPVSADKLPDIDGDPDHHWEISLRLVKTARPD